MLKETLAAVTLLGASWGVFEFADSTYAKEIAFQELVVQVSEGRVQGTIYSTRERIYQLEDRGCPPCKNAVDKDRYRRLKAELRDAEAKLAQLRRK